MKFKIRNYLFRQHSKSHSISSSEFMSRDLKIHTKTGKNGELEKEESERRMR